MNIFHHDWRRWAGHVICLGTACIFEGLASILNTGGTLSAIMLATTGPLPNENPFDEFGDLRTGDSFLWRGGAKLATLVEAKNAMNGILGETFIGPRH